MVRYLENIVHDVADGGSLEEGVQGDVEAQLSKADDDGDGGDAGAAQGEEVPLEDIVGATHAQGAADDPQHPRLYRLLLLQEVKTWVLKGHCYCRRDTTNNQLL